ncbi:MmcB family DNA repair protein [Rhodovulum sp. DZ06]|uniref:MmcB family DNA repair protein n=1 Tax=Rhodovulum sp. DZ06 TaxID=3425126 RepID=UPI003D326F7F
MAQNSPLPVDHAAARMQPGALLARGVCRFLVDGGFAPATEVSPARGLRCDVLALGPKGEIWAVECKSGLPDFRADRKWEGYLEWCDRLFFAVDADFPVEVLPEDQGLILADGFGAEIIRMPEARPLAAARRKALTARFARAAALRLRAALDPGTGAFSLGD